MKTIIVNKDSSMSVIDVDMPKISQSDQIIVKIAYSGLCGSDIPRIFNQGAHFYPITLGHEFSGEIIAMGDTVKNFAIGDYIASVPLLPCFECEKCKRHYYSLCKNYSFVGSRTTGGFAEYIVMSHKNAFKLPQGVSLLDGAFFEPLTVGMHAILLAGGCENKNVVIVGAGTIGLLAMQCAKAMGAASITVLDINDQRLDLAKELGADYTYNSGQLSADEIHTKMHERRFDQLILETAGNPATVNLSIQIAGLRAKLALVGTLHHDLTLSEKTFGLILRRELNIIGCWMNYSAPWPGKEWQLVSEFFLAGKIQLDKLTAGIGNFEQFTQLVTDLKGKPMSGKLLLKI